MPQLPRARDLSIKLIEAKENVAEYFVPFLHGEIINHLFK